MSHIKYKIPTAIRNIIERKGLPESNSPEIFWEMVNEICLEYEAQINNFIEKYENVCRECYDKM